LEYGMNKPKMIESNVVATYVSLEVAKRERMRDLWEIVGDMAECVASEWRDEKIEEIKACGASPKTFRNEFNVVLAMGPLVDEVGEHPYAFTPQMQSVVRDVAKTLPNPDDLALAYSMVVQTFPEMGGDAIRARMDQLVQPDPDARLKAAIEMIKANAESPLVKDAGIICA